MYLKFLFFFIFDIVAENTSNIDYENLLLEAKTFNLYNNFLTIQKKNGDKKTVNINEKNLSELELINKKYQILDIAKKNNLYVPNNSNSLSKQLNRRLSLNEWLPVIFTLAIGIVTFSILFFPQFMDGYNVFTFNRLLLLTERLQWNDIKEKEYYIYIQGRFICNNNNAISENDKSEYKKFYNFADPNCFNFIQIAFGLITLGVLAATLLITTNILMSRNNTIDIKFETCDNNFNLYKIAGNESVKKILKDLIFTVNNPDICKKRNIKTPKGFLFYGPPGNGKTLLAQAIANEMDVPFISLSASDFSANYGADIINYIFSVARMTKKCVLFIDEIDAIAPSRDDPKCDKESKIMLANLLTQIDGLNNKKGPEIILIGATNKIEDMDTALLRPGRLDINIFIDYPNEKERIEILQLYCKNLPINKDVKLQEIAKLAKNFSGAQLSKVVNDANIIAMKNAEKFIKQENFIQSVNLILEKTKEKDLYISKNPPIHLKY